MQTATQLQFESNSGNFLTNWATIRFSRKTALHNIQLLASSMRHEKHTWNRWQKENFIKILSDFCVNRRRNWLWPRKESLQHAVSLVKCKGNLGVYEQCTLNLNEFVIWVWQLVLVKYGALKYWNKVTILTLRVCRYDIALGPRMPGLQVNSIVSENRGISPETDYCTSSGWQKNATASICKTCHHQRNRRSLSSTTHISGVCLLGYLTILFHQ